MPPQRSFITRVAACRNVALPHLKCSPGCCIGIGSVTRRLRRARSNSIALMFMRMTGALLLKQNEEWAMQRRHSMPLEPLAAMSDDPMVNMPSLAACTRSQRYPETPPHHAMDNGR